MDHVVLGLGTDVLHLLHVGLVLVGNALIGLGTLDVVQVDHCRLVSEVPNILLVVQHLPVEGHDILSALGLDELAAHLLPYLNEAEVLKYVSIHASGHFAADLGDHLVDVVLEHRELLLNLSGVLVIEINDMLHAWRAAVDAVSTLGALDIQVVVEVLVELLQDQLNAVLAQDIASAGSVVNIGGVVERAENEFDSLGNISHSAVSVALQIDSL